MRSAAAALLLLAPLRLLPAGAQAGEIRFRQVTEEWGIDFRHHHGGSGERYMVETVVGGVVVLDYDDDGDADLFFVDGGALPGYAGETPRSRLLRNDGGGEWFDATELAGLHLVLYGAGATAADADGDGDLDLYVTAFGPNAYLVNGGDGTFRAAGPEAGGVDARWNASAAFADADRDGDLDLYVTGYLDFRLETHKFCGNEETGLQGYCKPAAYEGIADRLFRNRGDGTFEDVTFQAGLGGTTEAGLGVVWGDLDDDGWPDVYVANDADPNFLFLNRGDGTFEDVSLLSGAALGPRGDPEGGMGVDLGDVDGDGRLDIFVANFEAEANALYRNSGRGIFVDSRHAARLVEPSFLWLAFGTDLADLDHDGDLDLVVTNGHILDNAPRFTAGATYAQRDQVFENLGGGSFREVREHGIDRVAVGRGLATGDLDRDGDLDVVIVHSNDTASVYENLLEGDSGSWLQLELRAPGRNRWGIGARVRVETGGGKLVEEVRTGSSYLSQNDLVLHFGLGGATAAEAVAIRWPDGTRQRHRALPAGRRIRLTRGGD